MSDRSGMSDGSAAPSSVISGVSSGIGLATALRLRRDGDRVLGLSRRRPAGLDLPLEAPRAEGPWGGSGFAWRQADVRDASSLERALRGVDRIDRLVLNAGVCEPRSLDAPDFLDSYRETMDVNVEGALRLLLAARARLRPGGSVVVVSSGLGKQGRAGYAAYVASKHALLGIVRALALELLPQGIRVNAVCPGWVDTPMARADLQASAREGSGPRDVAARRRAAEARIPLGRFVRAEEVAALIAFLGSEAAAAISGQAYNISGGELLA
ncbi:MAG: SDR family oxidoreductase [Myxococcales bacterium]|nr:SDR family oxidoreductase [Myxococcales bacterium]